MNYRYFELFAVNILKKYSMPLLLFCRMCEYLLYFLNTDGDCLKQSICYPEHSSYNWYLNKLSTDEKIKPFQNMFLTIYNINCVGIKRNILWCCHGGRTRLPPPLPQPPLPPHPHPFPSARGDKYTYTHAYDEGNRKTLTWPMLTII